MWGISFGILGKRWKMFSTADSPDLCKASSLRSRPSEIEMDIMYCCDSMLITTQQIYRFTARAPIADRARRRCAPPSTRRACRPGRSRSRCRRRMLAGRRAAARRCRCSFPSTPNGRRLYFRLSARSTSCKKNPGPVVRASSSASYDRVMAWGIGIGF